MQVDKLIESESRQWFSFDHYVTKEQLQQRKEPPMKDKIVIEPTDTKHTLKRKRNGGCCEYPGCCSKGNTEWHHEHATALGLRDQRGGNGQGNSREQNGVYRKVSDFKPTENPHVIHSYEQQMQLCTLLCKIHHENTHTNYLHEKYRLQQQHTATKRLVIFAALRADVGVLAAVRGLRALRNLDF
jgi:hypothetical protein